MQTQDNESAAKGLIEACLEELRANPTEQVAREAAQTYAPMAHKLGYYNVKRELEDLSLKVLEREAYYHIKEKLNETRRSRDAYIERFISQVTGKLAEGGLACHVKGRPKSIHSIWQKMKKQGVDVEGVYDLFAIRIIIDSKPERELADCWQAFSIVTNLWPSNPKRMRDWLSAPKPNGYESLHITVLGPEERWVEVQIRTERMDDIAEHGLAAHWRYKGGRGTGAKASDVYVFTPRGDLHQLPAGATVLDFAFSIHTKVGLHCTGGKVDGKMVTMRQELHSGDHVEILTSPSQTPREAWTDIVKTAKARNKIRQCLKEMAATQAKMAKEELERKMRNHKIDTDEPTLMRTIGRMGYKVVTDFYAALAEGKMDTAQVIEEYIAERDHTHAPIIQAPTAQPKEKNTSILRDEVIIGSGSVRGLEVTMAKCCTPQPGDEVFGFVSLWGGIRIHRTTCPNAPHMKANYDYRMIKARWATTKQ